jgi:hypothetical protein
MIVDNGFKIAVNRIAKDTPDYTVASRFKVGVSQATVTSSDTDLTNPIPIYDTEEVSTCDAVTDWNYTTDGDIDTTSTAYKQGSYSLTLIKDAQTVDNVTWYNEDLASLDFTSKDLWGWIYIKDTAALNKLATSDCLEVRYGNDYNTNYYKYLYDKSDLAVGWNIIKFNITDATEVGTVTDNACDSLAIKLTFTATTDELATDEIMIDDFKLASLTDYYKDFTSGYPTVDETNFEIVTESYLNSVEANGFLIDGVGTFNTDGTALMQDAFQFTAISKSNSEEIIFEIKNRLKRR